MTLALWCVLLVVQAATATLAPTRRSGGPVVNTCLRVRGGEAAPPEAPPRNALTREEITEKMNAIPVFFIANDKGGMVGVRGKDDGKEAICWFTDAQEAKAILEVMREHNPDVELHLGVHGLGTAFRICKGWPEDDSPSLQAGSSPFTGELRLQGNMPLTKETTPRLKEMLSDAGIDAGAWQLPIFLCEELQSSSVLPVFLSPADLAATWEKSGRKKEDMPEGITMMDLRMLVAQMQTEGPNPWRAIHFVASQAAYELVREVAGSNSLEDPLNGQEGEENSPSTGVSVGGEAGGVGDGDDAMEEETDELYSS